MAKTTKVLSDPVVMNVYGDLMAEVASLKKQFGLSDLSIAVRGGKYFLNVDGNLIEVTVVNGKMIPVDAFADLNATLSDLLEKNGYSEVTESQFSLPQLSDSVATTGGAQTGLTQTALAILGSQTGLATLGFGSIAILSALNTGSGSGPRLEGIDTDTVSNSLVLDYDEDLNPGSLPDPSDFEVYINNELTSVSDVRISDDKVTLEVMRNLQPGDSVQLTYKDQNGDTQNSIQNVDGDLAAAFIQGVVIDGYIAGAQMFIDKDGDGIPDPDELLEGTTTDANGMFIMDAGLNPEGYPLLITGGTNIDTGLANNTVLTAPAGSTVITPTTTLIQTMVRNGLSVDEAETTLKNALGIDTAGPNTVDLLNFDPINAIKNDPQNAAAVALHKANTSIVQIIESVGTGSSANAIAATAKVAELIVEQSPSTDPADWSALSGEVVDSVFVSGNNGALKTELGLIVEAIQEADGANILEAIASAQKGVVVAIDTPDIPDDLFPVISGSATPGSTVTIVVQNALLPEDPSTTYEVTAAADGSWSVDTEVVVPSEGTLSLNTQNIVSATATKLGVTSETLRVDLPLNTVVTVETPDVTNDQTPVISGSATPGSTVTIVVQNELLPEDPGATYEVTAAADGSWSVDTEVMVPVAGTLSLSDSNTVSATATKFEIASAPVTFSLDIDTTAPVANLAVFDDFGFITGTLTSGDTTDDSQLVLTGTNEAGSTVEVFNGTTSLGNATILGEQWRYIAAIEDGTTYEFNTIETDAAGNPSNPTANITITGDSTAPSAPELELATDTNVSDDGITSDAIVNVTGIETGATWGYSVDAGSSWNAGTGTSFELAEGNYADGDIKVSQYDLAGNLSTEAALSGEITVDSTAPVAPMLTAVEDTDKSSFDEGFTVDEGSDVVVTVNGAVLDAADLEAKFTQTTDAASGLDTYAAKVDVFDGTETITIGATITDVAGNQSTAATPIALQKIDTTAPTKPTLTAVADTDNSSFDEKFTVAAGSDVVVNIAGTALNPAQLAEKFTKTTDAGVDTYAAKEGEFDGTETIRVDATISDAAGNQSVSATQIVLKKIDTTAPSAFAIDATLEVDNIVNAVEDDTVSVTGTSTGVEQGQTVSVTLSDGSTDVDVTATVGSDGTWTATDADISALTNGSITITADVSDTAGNAANQVIKTITLDNVAPTAALTAATDDVGSSTGTLTTGDTTDDTALVLSGTNESGSTVEVFNGTTSLGAATVTGTTWSYSATVADGTTYAFNAKETDAAGNTSTATADFDVIGDTTAPSLTITTPIESDGVVNAAEDDTVVVAGTTSGVEDGETVTVTFADGINTDVTATTTVLSNAWALSGSEADISSLKRGSITSTADVSDAAGNAATQVSETIVKAGVSFAGIDVDANDTLDFTDPNTTAGEDGGGDRTIDIILDVSEAEENDVFELYIDGTLINTSGTTIGTTITQSDITSGTMEVADVDVGSPNDSDTSGTGVNTTPDEVLIEVKLRDTATNYVQDGGDVTWDYQY